MKDRNEKGAWGQFWGGILLFIIAVCILNWLFGDSDALTNGSNPYKP